MKKNDVFNYLACNLGTESDEPNIELASSLCKSRNEDAVVTLIEGLKSSSSEVASDCIKVLYELGRRSPDMIADHVPDFIRILSSQDSSMVSGGMSALAEAARLNPADVYAHRESVIRAYEKGDDLIRNEAVRVCAEVSRADPRYEHTMFPFILRDLETCRPEEILQHAERALTAVNKENAAAFRSVLEKRIDLLSVPQRKIMENLLHAV